MRFAYRNEIDNLYLVAFRLKKTLRESRKFKYVIHLECNNKIWAWLIRDKNRAIVCGQSVYDKDYLPSLARLSVSQVSVTHFKNRSWRSVSGPSIDEQPIIDRRSVDSKLFAKAQNSWPIPWRNFVLKVEGVLELFYNI